MASSRQRPRGALGLLLIGVAIGTPSGTAMAGQEFLTTTTIAACGKWVLKLQDFGKEKIRSYNSFTAQALGLPRLKPTVSFQFVPASRTFAMTTRYPDAEGMADPMRNNTRFVTQVAFGRYTQKGKKLKLRLNDPGAPFAGVTVLEKMFSDFVENQIFGQRQINTIVPFVDIRESKIRFKGRVKKRSSLRMKMKAKLVYDIQSDNNSEVPDRFDAKGRFKMRLKTKDCP